MFIDLPPQTEQIIAQVAKQNGQSLQDFIVISAYEKALQSMANPPTQGLGDRLHQIFAQAQFPELNILERQEYPRF
ncbi:type II toxin -antitoxin system TacA 1-like antitoxin [Moraxella oblonga]|uniref:type II toxin -antitoxin system TacA 1-like antitoxin n=1 Tax=Moraxella oblonga TaxID=200413 RepID=UPI0008340BED|nr:DUF1778 domain-containing protein [Moraxella oblonga]